MFIFLFIQFHIWFLFLLTVVYHIKCRYVYEKSNVSAEKSKGHLSDKIK